MENLTDIINIMIENGDKEKAAPMSAYMKNKFEFLGVQTKTRRSICKDYFAKAKKEDSIDWDFVKKCWGDKYREMQYVAANYLEIKSNLLTPKDIPKLKKLITTKSWWDTVDGLDKIVGSISFKYPEVKRILLEWSIDENIWLRRVAIDHQLLRKGETDTELMEKILLNNLDDKEFFINKAIGWSLRDYSKTDPNWVSAFIDRNRERMAPLSIREASKYI